MILSPKRLPAESCNGRVVKTTRNIFITGEVDMHMLMTSLGHLTDTLEKNLAALTVIAVEIGGTNVGNFGLRMVEGGGHYSIPLVI